MQETVQEGSQESPQRSSNDSEPPSGPKLAGILTFPPEVVAALDEHCAVERLARDRAICEIVAEYLRIKGYLRARPVRAHHASPGEKPAGA
ncbi:hypothetical protein BY998_1203 [Methylobacterium sp. B4]|nr:hypothetical protein BY998_1203 [Methylobacterium sp. B4]